MGTSSKNGASFLPIFPVPGDEKFVSISLKRPVNRDGIYARHRDDLLKQTHQESFDGLDIGLTPRERRTLDELVSAEYSRKQSGWVKTSVAQILTQIFVEMFNGQSERGARIIDLSTGEAQQLQSMPDVIQPYRDPSGAFAGNYMYELKTTTTSSSPIVKGKQVFNYLTDLRANNYMGTPVAGLGYVFVRYTRHKDTKLEDLSRHDFSKYIVTHLADMTIVPSNLLLALYATATPVVYEPQSHHVKTQEERGTRRQIRGGLVGELNKMSDSLHDDTSAQTYLAQLESQAHKLYLNGIADGAVANVGDPLPFFLGSLRPKRFRSPRIVAECGSDMVPVREFPINYFHFQDQDVLNNRLRPLDVLSSTHAEWLHHVREYFDNYVTQSGLAEFLPGGGYVPQQSASPASSSGGLDEDVPF